MRTFRAAALLLPLMMLCSCLPVPLGDPEKSAADAKYLGAWTWAEGGGVTNVVVIRPWDARTYVVDVMAYTGDTSAPVPKMRIVYKAWLTNVKGYPFITMAPIDTLTGQPANNQRKYLVAMLTLERDQLTATGLDAQYGKFKDVATPTQLEKVITENFDDVKMWAKPITATKLNEGGSPDLDKLGKLFENLGR